MNKFLKILVSIIISGVGLYFAFKGEHFGVLWIQIMETKLIPFTNAVLLLIYGVYVRAKRWQYILDPIEKVDDHTLFASTMVGYFGNGVLFFRLGELLRGYSLSSKTSLSVSQAFGTVLLERVLDIISVMAVIIAISPWYPYEDPIFRSAVIAMVVISFSAGIFLFLSQRFYWIDKLSHLNFFQKGFGKLVFQITEKIFDGMTLLRETKHGFIIVFYSLFLWIIYYLTTMFLLESVGIDIGLIGPGVILIAGSIGIAIPALPGSAGTYDAIIKFALITMFAISSEKALTYALVSHSATFFPLVIIGMIYFIIGSVRIKDIKKGSEDNE
ncbi:MAG: flippase-like domain-containing protein [Candidatus Marinimicrobia bacterium]|nr:flippase-like domain-containing protein [Candidatus Neomarinimicrobiota bacterium]